MCVSGAGGEEGEKKRREGKEGGRERREGEKGERIRVVKKILGAMCR